MERENNIGHNRYGQSEVATKGMGGGLERGGGGGAIVVRT